ncbi:MAG: lactate dehydrogenase [Clostridia bacterium]|nr:lactate dehydrogenase [Clostridia bacterium]
MKVYFYEVKDYEEVFIRAYAQQYGFEVCGIDPECLSLENIDRCEGCDAVSTLGFSRCDGEVMRVLGGYGVKYFATRTVGYNHVDVESAAKCGITVIRADYDSTNVSDYTVMLILMLLRKTKVTVVRGLVNNFSLDEIMGRDLRDMTVGIIGTGKIGKSVIKSLSGFGCRLLCHDKYPDSEVEKYAKYCDLGDIYSNCDVISLHMPLTDENYHMIDAAAISAMKKGVLLVNTARGGLIDTEALKQGIETEQIGGAALDTIEGEDGICHVDIKTRISNKQNLFYLKQVPNVIYTPHIGFFTEQAVSQMVESVFLGISLSSQNKENRFIVK